MHRKKLKSLVSIECDVKAVNPILSRLSDIVFEDSYRHEYVPSNYFDKRYGAHAKVAHKRFKGLRNDCIRNFMSMGENEKYLFNSVLFGNKNVVFLLGGVGTGKSRFVSFKDAALRNQCR